MRISSWPARCRLHAARQRNPELHCARAKRYRANRQFNARRPNALWVSDFIYVSTWQGRLFVAFVVDVYIRRIVG